jgi:hypothetical protein
VDTRRILNKAEGQQWHGGGLGKAGGFFLFCPGRLKVIFLIVSKAVASFSQPLMPAVVPLNIFQMATLNEFAI